jgi:hypothetical protein
MLNAQCSMLNAQCSMLNAQCSMLNAMLNAQCSMLNAQCSMLNARCLRRIDHPDRGVGGGLAVEHWASNMEHFLEPLSLPKGPWVCASAIASRLPSAG